MKNRFSNLNNQDNHKELKNYMDNKSKKESAVSKVGVYTLISDYERQLRGQRIKRGIHMSSIRKGTSYLYYFRKATEDLENETNVKRENIKSMLEKIFAKYQKIATYFRQSLSKPLLTSHEE